MLPRSINNCYLVGIFIFFQVNGTMLGQTIKAATEKPKVSQTSHSPSKKITTPAMKLGLENIEDAMWLKLGNSANKKASIGLITNHTGKNQQGSRTIDVLLQRGLAIKKIFVPEHGLDGQLAAEKEVKDSIDAKTNISVVSLYGQGTGKKIPAQKLKDIDVLIFDMQDSGMRHYTYVSTLLYVLEAAGMYNKSLIVLDRPNPLGVRMEGPLVDNFQKSFISVASIPLRHGMTIGEL